MVPDYALIAEIRLYSFGYRDARRLSQKMVKTFQLSSEQLSSQDHYDFGMRAVNTVIQAAGNNRAANPDMVEDLLVLSALADSNRPKFLAEDMILFNSILSDLFPGQEVPKPDYSDLIERITFHCKENNKIVSARVPIAASPARVARSRAPRACIAPLRAPRTPRARCLPEPRVKGDPARRASPRPLRAPPFLHARPRPR